MATSEKYPSQADLTQRLSAMESRLQKLERGSPGTLTTFYNSQGDVLLRAGKDPVTGDKLFEVNRDGGAPAIAVTSNGNAQQSVQLYDHGGSLIVGDSVNYTDGLRRPSISHNVMVIGDTPPAQTSNIFITVAEAHFRKTNPTLEVLLYYYSSDGATGVQLRFRDITTNTVLADSSGFYQPNFNPAPIVQARLLTPALILGSQFPVGGEIDLIVEAQRTSGTGTFTVHVLSVRGGDL